MIYPRDNVIDVGLAQVRICKKVQHKIEIVIMSIDYRRQENQNIRIEHNRIFIIHEEANFYPPTRPNKHMILDVTPS